MSQSTSHFMKTTRRGRPFIKDTHDLFATLVVSLPMATNRQFFKSYPNSFTTDIAAANLAHLKFSQSNRSTDPKDPSRIITTTTTTTFTMNRDMAKGICQHFMDARLIENAADLTSSTFKDRGVYMLTPKGLHILERFITKNGISAEHLLRVFAMQPICMKLLHLERRATDDEILISRSIIEVLFRRFVGRTPNMSKLSNEQYDSLQAQTTRSSSATGASSSIHDDLDRTLGIGLRKYNGAAGLMPPNATSKEPPELVFYAIQAIDWLLDFTTLVGKDEACEILGHFVRYGLIKIVADKASRSVDDSTTVVVRAGGPGGGTGAMLQEAEFRWGDKIIYKITHEGSRCARWNEKNNATLERTDSSLEYHLTSHSASVGEASTINPIGSFAAATDNKLMRRASVTDRLRMDYLDSNGGAGTVAGQIAMDKSTPGQAFNAQKDSHTGRLRQILEEPALRSLFREFLRANLCEENLSFWLDVQDFKRRFNTTSSAVASPLAKPETGKTHGAAAMEKHQQDIVTMAFVIYNSYLAPGSQCELNIDHNLREELVAYMNKVFADVASREANAMSEPDKLDPVIAAKSMQSSQLQNLVRLYERIQGYIFRLMATDSVPKFCKTDRYINLMRSVFDMAVNFDKFTDTNKEKDYMDDTTTRAYITISQAANEKQAALQKQAATTH